MSNLVDIERQLESSGYVKDGKGIFKSGRGGYWSNLNKEDNKNFLEALREQGPREAVKRVIPQYEDIIFSPSREGALELLDIQKGDIGIDYGCMWGVLSVGMAKRGASVVAIDQTFDSLDFLKARGKDEGLENIVCVQDDIREVRLKGLADFSVVNGVLEWVPEFGEIELGKYYGKKQEKSYDELNPYRAQQKFLETVSGNLKVGGKLLLAIENRYDYTHFLGKPDPHANLLFTAVLPREIASWISKIRLGRPYVNYLYSFPRMKKMILKAGFSKVDLYMAFPDYRYPSMIFPYEKGVNKYQRYWEWRNISWKRKIAYSIEYFLMKILRARFFAPSIIAIAEK